MAKVIPLEKQIEKLREYALLEQEWSNACDRNRPDWSDADVMAFVDKYGLTMEPIGQFMKKKRMEALNDTEDEDTEVCPNCGEIVRGNVAGWNTHWRIPDQMGEDGWYTCRRRE